MREHVKVKHFALGSFILGFLILTTMSLRALLLMASHASASLAYATPPTPRPSQHLQVTNNGSFQITIFEDLHYGEAEDLVWGPQQDVNSTRVMNAILDTETPQLVVLNGDLITGENTHLENSTWYIDDIVAPLVKRGLPWASTYGNHDSDFNLSRQGLYDREKRYENSLTGNMVNDSDAGVTNYHIPVYSSIDPSPTTAPDFLLWFFDSRGGNYFQQSDGDGDAVPQPDWVDVSVVEWFKTTSTALAVKYQTYIPSVAFVHIPVNAMLAFQALGEVDKHLEPGINDDVPLAAQGGAAEQGTANATTNANVYQGQDHAFMQALLGVKGLLAVFSG